MNWNRSLRQIHRWTSMVFTVSIVAVTVALMQDEPLVWVSYVPLFPLVILLLTGLYLFTLPLANRRRLGKGAGRQS
jgi:hypothetical protein